MPSRSTPQPEPAGHTPGSSILLLRLPLPLRMGRVNCALLRSEDGFILVDTGGANARGQLLQALEQAGCVPGSLRLILLTHGDFDHVGNAAFLRSALGAPIALHPDDAGMAQHGDLFAGRGKPNALVRILMPLAVRLRAADRFTPDLWLEDGADLAVYGLEARVVGLPGHSAGSVGLLTADGTLFCGDLLENTKGPALNSLTDDRAAGLASVAKLRGLGVSVVYPGHGEPFPLEGLA